MGKELFSLFFQRFVSRRRLLMMARNVAIFSTIVRHTPKVTAASSPQQQLSAVGYGQGGYGEGKYPAEMRQNIYLPIVNKKGE